MVRTGDWPLVLQLFRLDKANIQCSNSRIIADQRAGAMDRIRLSEDWLSKRFAAQYDLSSSLSLCESRFARQRQ